MFFFQDLESSPELSQYIWSQILVTLSTIISTLNLEENKTQTETQTTTERELLKIVKFSLKKLIFY